MSPFQTLEFECSPNGIATLWLNRPQRRNALDAQMIDELLQALDRLEAMPGLRFVVLRGRGEHFCAGADLDWMRASARLGPAANLADAQRLSELLYRLHALPLPTLAVVQGAAFGGALGLVSCCDLAIGSDSARFALSEVRLGLAPALISPFVVQAMGARATRRYALSAEVFDGRQAMALGLLAECVDEARLDACLQRWQQRLLDNGPQAMRACKALLQTVGNRPPDAQLRQHCEQTIAALRISAEGQEGLQAFLEKRPPSWQCPTRAPEPQVTQTGPQPE